MQDKIPEQLKTKYVIPHLPALDWIGGCGIQDILCKQESISFILYIVSCIRRNVVWIPAGVYPWIPAYTGMTKGAGMTEKCNFVYLVCYCLIIGYWNLFCNWCLDILLKL